METGGVAKVQGNVDHLVSLSQRLIDLSEATGVADEMAGVLKLRIGIALRQRGELKEATELIGAVARDVLDSKRKLDIAGELVLLAKAWEKHPAAVDGVEQSERVLRLAVDLAPSVGYPALAQHYQRYGHREEAIDCWREAVRVSPHESQLYLNLARLYHQTGQVEPALATYLDLIAAAPSARNVLIVAERLDDLKPLLPALEPQAMLKIALVGNATLDHLQSYLKIECYRAGFRPEFYQSGFDQYTQELLNEQSNLYAFRPDVLICAIHASRLFPNLHDYPFDLTVEARRAEIDAGLNTVQRLLAAFTRQSSAMVLLHNVVAPQYPAIGIADLRDEFGQAAAFSEINTRLAELVRTQFRNVYLVDEDRVQARSGKAQATDPRLWLTARLPWSDAVLHGLAHEYLRYLKPYRAMTRKCIVVDLDQTLWGGVVGEDGVRGIQIGADAPGNAFQAFQRELEKLWRRGVLLAIASKNNPEDALAVFEQHPGMVLKQSHFAAQRINWEAKADNIRAIAKELNIGLGSLVFLDDNPVERAKVRAELPQVLTPELPTDPSQYRYALLDLDVFESLALTEEDRQRNQLYVDQKARHELEASHGSGGSLNDFLADLEMSVEIAPATAMTLPRIAQLTNKTNQFNLTTRRYSEAQITEMESRGGRVYGMRVSDRFGDNGLVGVAIVVPRDSLTWELDTLLLSCRVMGRGVEAALLAFVVEQARVNGIKRLEGWYIPTPKNIPVKSCYADHGFTLVEQQPDGRERWDLDIQSSAIQAPAWLTVHIQPEVESAGSRQ